jgi:NTE family protein
MDQQKTINVALQGGGSHGAFTWGVLEKLLEDGRLSFSCLCGTSAGAVNTVALAYGLHKGGPAKAIELMEKIWYQVSMQQSFSPLQPSPVSRLFGDFNVSFSPMYYLYEFWSQLLSPYQFNPANLNPLRQILERNIDFEELQQSRYNIYLCATNVKTCRAKVFSCNEITSDAVLASTCLPQVFQAVKINGEAYWDGGFMGNPPIFPLIDNSPCPDILLIQINAIEIDFIPTSVDEIKDRLNEVSFNSNLMREMRSINQIDKLVNKYPELLKSGLKKLYMHHVNAGDYVEGLSIQSKLNADWNFLNYLRERGRSAAEDWLNNHFSQIGKESSVDMQKVFL